MTFNLFNFHTGKCLLKDVNRKEIVGYTGISYSNVSRYARERRLYKNRYSIQIESEDETEEERFIESWNRAIEPFKNVKWVKEGGKKLKL